MEKVKTVLYMLGPILFIAFMVLMAWVGGQGTPTKTEITDPADQLDVAPYEELPYGI